MSVSASVFLSISDSQPIHLHGLLPTALSGHHQARRVTDGGHGPFPVADERRLLSWPGAVGEGDGETQGTLTARPGVGDGETGMG